MPSGRLPARRRFASTASLVAVALVPFLVSRSVIGQVYRSDNNQLIPGTENISPAPGADFSSLDLSYAALRFKNLTAATFTSADLTSANLYGSTLTSAKFISAVLTFADLSNSELTSANFLDADVRFANLASNNFGGYISGGFTLDQLYSTASYRARDLRGISIFSNNLSSANFASVDLSGATFGVDYDIASNLTGANFSSANLSTANLFGCDLRSANFAVANLNRAWIYQAKVTGADFASADLTRAYLDDSTLTATHFNSANLTRASLREANLTSANFASANLTSATFTRSVFALNGTILTSANFTAADLRRATEFSPSSSTLLRNTLLPDGTVGGGSTPGLALLPGDTLTVRDNPVALTVNNAFSITAGATLEFRFSDPDFTSPINTSLTPTLGGTLALNLDPDFPGFDPNTLLNIPLDLFNFTGPQPVTRFAFITTNINPSLYRWDTSSLYTTGVVTLQYVPEPNAILLPLPALMAARRPRRAARSHSRPNHFH